MKVFERRAMRHHVTVLSLGVLFSGCTSPGTTSTAPVDQVRGANIAYICLEGEPEHTPSLAQEIADYLEGHGIWAACIGNQVGFSVLIHEEDAERAYALLLEHKATHSYKMLPEDDDCF